MSLPPVVCVDFTPHPFEQFDDKPTLSETVLPNCVRMVYDTAALGNTSFQKGANVFAVFIGISSHLRFGFFYTDVSHVDKSLDAALVRCMKKQNDGLLTIGMNRWGDLNVPFCNLLSGSATHRPADEAVHAGARLLPAIKYGTGKVLDYVRENGQTVAVVVGSGVLPPHVGAAVARAIRDGTCVAMYCLEDVHPCDKTSVFWLALEALRAFTWSKTPVALPEVPTQKPPTTAPAETVELLKKVKNLETPQVFDHRFEKHESPTTRLETVVTPWAEPPHRNEQIGVTMRAHQSAKWTQAGWKCSTTKTQHTWTHPMTGEVFDEEHNLESWQHNDYGPTTFSRCDMKDAVLKIDHENNVFARNGFYPISKTSRGPDALFRASDSTEDLTRAEVRVRITAEENAEYEAAGFTCALVDDELRFCQGGVMPKTEEWRHKTYDVGICDRKGMPKALQCIREAQAKAADVTCAQAVPERVQGMLWQKNKKAKTGMKPGL
jgi:hypothetical protein